MTNMQLIANYGTIDNVDGFITESRGSGQNLRAQAKTYCKQTLENMGIGAGSAQYEACMRMLDQKLDAYEQDMTKQSTQVRNAGDGYRGAGQQMIKTMSTPTQV